MVRHVAALVAALVVGLMALTGAALEVDARDGTTDANASRNSTVTGTLEEMPLPAVAQNWSAVCPSMETSDWITGTYKVDMSSGSLRYVSSVSLNN